jgi:DNA-binding transcriptional LysR family regulator
MTPHQLKLFVAAARQGSITAAAADLRIAQPSVTEQLRLLENELGTRLHSKTGRGIELTPAGRVFLKEARVIISRMEGLKRRLASSLACRAVEPLTVGGSYSPSASLLPSLLARFQKTYPQVQLVLRTGNGLAIERLVLKGEVDLAIIHNPPINHQLTMEAYQTEPYIVFVAAAHPLAKRKQLSSEDLRQVGFITRKGSRSTGTLREYLQHLKNNGFKPNVIMRCDTPEAVKEAVRSKMGAGILFKRAVTDSIARHEFEVLKMPGEPFEGKSYIIYHKKRPLSPSAREFLNLLHTYRSKS